MHVVLVGHSKLAKRKNPDSVDWDWYVPAVDHRAAGVIQQWADLVCLCVKEEGGQKSEGRGKGYSTGRRIMKTDGEATYMAKSRLDMPAEVELAAKNPAAPILEALRRMSPASTASMDELLGMVQGTEHKKRIATMLAGGPSQQQVDKSIEWIRSKA